MAFPRARYLLIEPVGEWWGRISARVRALDYIAAPVAAASFDGVIELHVYRDLEASGVLVDPDREGEERVVRTVSARRIDSLCAEHHLSGPLLVKIDVQGSELDVLAGAERILDRLEVVVLETRVCPSRVPVRNVTDVARWAGANGFVVVDICDGLAQASSRVLLQVDLALVREGGEVHALFARLASERGKRERRRP